MSRAQITLCSRSEREKAARWISQAPTGTRVTFKESKRSTDQNSKLWAGLTDIATQVLWHGDRLTPDDWKLIFLDGLNREMRNVPSLDGSGIVNLGRSSSNLSKSEFSDLLELIQMFGAEHGVVFHDQLVPEEA
jgi:hypothetical protein